MPTLKTANASQMMKTLTLTLPASLLKLVDGRRGRATRSEFVRDVIRIGIANKVNGRIGVVRHRALTSEAITDGESVSTRLAPDEVEWLNAHRLSTRAEYARVVLTVMLEEPEGTGAGR